MSSEQLKPIFESMAPITVVQEARRSLEEEGAGPLLRLARSGINGNPEGVAVWTMVAMQLSPQNENEILHLGAIFLLRSYTSAMDRMSRQELPAEYLKSQAMKTRFMQRIILEYLFSRN
jgi:hypothetical protein